MYGGPVRLWACALCAWFVYALHGLCIWFVNMFCALCNIIILCVHALCHTNCVSAL